MQYNMCEKQNLFVYSTALLYGDCKGFCHVDEPSTLPLLLCFIISKAAEQVEDFVSESVSHVLQTASVLLFLFFCIFLSGAAGGGLIVHPRTDLSVNGPCLS